MRDEGNPLRRMIMGRQGTRGGRPMGTRQGQGMTPQPAQVSNPQLAPMMKNPAMKGALGGVGKGLSLSQLNPAFKQQMTPGVGKPEMVQNIPRFEGGSVPPQPYQGGGSPQPGGIVAWNDPRRQGQGSPQPGLGGIGLPNIIGRMSQGSGTPGVDYAMPMPGLNGRLGGPGSVEDPNRYKPKLGQQAQVNAGVQPGTIPGAGAALNPLRQQQPPQMPPWFQGGGGGQRFGMGR